MARAKARFWREANAVGSHLTDPCASSAALAARLRPAGGCWLDTLQATGLSFGARQTLSETMLDRPTRRLPLETQGLARLFGADDRLPFQTGLWCAPNHCLGAPSETLHAFGVDDDDAVSFCSQCCSQRRITSTEHNWVTSAERRSTWATCSNSLQPN